MTKVVTWQTISGLEIHICGTCERKLLANWPRDPKTGEEYCQVSHGEHTGICSVCGQG